MIPASAAPQPFTPPWYLDQGGVPRADARTYLVRPGTVADRAMFEGEIAGPPWNAGRVFPWDLITCGEQAVSHLLDGDYRGQALEAMATWRANVLTPEAMPEETRQLLAGIEMALRVWPAYGELRRAEARRTHVLPMLAVRWFLAGWQGVEQPFALGPDGKASEASMAAIPVHDLNAVGWHAYNLMHADQHRPLSPPPSTSGGNRRRSARGVKRRAGKVAG